MPIIVYASFYRASSSLCGAKKTCMVRSDDIGGVQTGKVLTLKYVIVSRVFFIRFFFYSEDRRGTASVKLFCIIFLLAR